MQVPWNGEGTTDSRYSAIEHRRKDHQATPMKPATGTAMRNHSQPRALTRRKDRDGYRQVRFAARILGHQVPEMAHGATRGGG